MKTYNHKHGFIVRLDEDVSEALGYVWVFVIEPTFSKPMPSGVKTLAMARKVANAMIECMQ
jgi:hypothetical protein